VRRKGGGGRGGGGEGRGGREIYLATLLLAFGREPSIVMIEILQRSQVSL